MTEKTLTTENIKPALDALRGELAPWPVVAKKQDRLNAAQLNAANSGITSSLVAQIIANTAAIRALESAITGTGLRPIVVASLPAIGTQGILYIVPVTTYDPATDADVVNYSNEYIWIVAPDAPVTEGYYEQVGQTGIVINNGQLTITVNGTSVGTFTANQAGDTTAAITVPTNADYVDLTTSQTVTGGKTWTGEQSFTLPIVGSITGTASKAIADEDGNSIKTGYVNVAGNQTVTGQKTWSGNQFFTSNLYAENTSYTLGTTPSDNVVLGNYYLTAATHTYIGLLRTVIYSNGRTGTEIRARNKFKNGALDTTGTDVTASLNLEIQPDGTKTLYFDGSIRNDVLPYTTNTYSLGSSSYQWSSVYAQTYYYNGTAWGLDKVNEWSNTNRFLTSVTLKNTSIEKGVIPSSNSSKLIYFTDKNNADLSTITARTNSTGESYIALRAENLYKNGVMDSTGSLAYSTLYIGLTSDGKSYCVPRADVYPEYNNYYNLGTSTNQWKSVYSQTYYYNGTQWGLDKSNVWTGTQTIEQSTFAQLRLKNSTVRMGDAIPSSQKTVGAVTFSDSNNSNMGFVDFRDSTQGNTFVRIIARQKYDANGDRSTSGTIYESGIDVGVLNDKTPYVAPTSNAAAQLGTSTNKWKTLNGINPGALSLPQGGNSTAISVDITEWYVQDPAYPDDPTELILDETEHVVTTSVPGWLRVTFPNVAGNYAYARQYQAGANMADEKIATGISEVTGVNFIFPIHDALVVKIKAKSASVTIYPCMGNV